MGGILNFRGRAKPSPALCLPDETGWLLWTYPPGGAAPVSVPLEPEAVAGVPPGTRIGLPARHVTTVLLWFQTVDPSAFRDLARNELERRGCLRLEVAWDYLLVRQEEGRSLVCAFLVDASLAPALLVIQAGSYEVAARCRLLPPNGYVLWREQGGLVLAAVRNSCLASLHYYPGAAFCAEIAAEVGALLRELTWEGAMEKTAGCVAWGDFSADDLAGLAPAFGAPPRSEPLPIPIPPEPPLALLPPEVDLGQRRRERSRRRRALALYAAAAYLLFLLVAAAAFGWQMWRIHSLSEAVRIDAPVAAKSKGGALRWRALAPAVDSSYYPLECLLACVKALPQEVRITDFEQTPDKVLVLGEGKDAASIYRFLDQVKADPFLKKWSWAMPQPQVPPNSRAKFHLEGSREAQAAQ